MTIVDIPLTYTRDELLAVLRAKREDAVNADAENLRLHQQNERAYLKAFKEACREAAKLTYEEAKAIEFDARQLLPKIEESYWNGRPRLSTMPAPSCPISLASRIDSAIAMVAKKSERARITVQDGGIYRGIYVILTDDVPSITGLC